ncbi:MAG TPA: hypothetical protein VLS47_01020 [Gallionella sp.]|nr:hypothetical protein [Gallionella sp.]
MKMQLIFTGFCAMLALSPLAANAEPSAKDDSCVLLKPDDMTKLFGATPEAKSNKGVCVWTTSGGKSRLIVAKSPNTGMAADMAYSGARKNAAQGGTVSDLKGLGDKAFARVGPFGVVLVIFKDSKLLQMQYRTEAAGTSQDLDALMPVAKKATEAL